MSTEPSRCIITSPEYERLKRIEAAAKAVVESAGTYPTRALYADIKKLDEALAPVKL